MDEPRIFHVQAEVRERWIKGEQDLRLVIESCLQEASIEVLSIKVSSVPHPASAEND
jgi:hypothetical protein